MAVDSNVAGRDDVWEPKMEIAGIARHHVTSQRT